MSFFLGSWEMNRSAEQTNRVNCDLFFSSSWEMNRSAEQTNRTRTASHEPRKKRHSFLQKITFSIYTLVLHSAG